MENQKIIRENVIKILDRKVYGEMNYEDMLNIVVVDLIYDFDWSVSGVLTYSKTILNTVNKWIDKNID